MPKPALLTLKGAEAPFLLWGKTAVYILLFVFYRCRILITTFVEGERIMKEMTALPDGELEIMQIVWQCQPPVSRSIIEEKLKKEKYLAPSTILTFLTRLCDRGFLRSERHGRMNLYTPLISKRDYLAKESRRMLERLYGGSISAFAVSLCDSGITKDEIETLRKMLEEDTL